MNSDYLILKYWTKSFSLPLYPGTCFQCYQWSHSIMAIAQLFYFFYVFDKFWNFQNEDSSCILPHYFYSRRSSPKINICLFSLRYFYSTSMVIDVIILSFRRFIKTNLTSSNSTSNSSCNSLSHIFFKYYIEIRNKPQ